MDGMTINHIVSIDHGSFGEVGQVGHRFFFRLCWFCWKNAETIFKDGLDILGISGIRPIPHSKKVDWRQVNFKRCRVSIAVSKIGHDPRSTGTIHTMKARMENLKMGLKGCLHIGSGNVCGLGLKGVTNEIDKVSMIHHFQRTLDSVVAVFCTGSRCLNLFMCCNSCGYIWVPLWLAEMTTDQPPVRFTPRHHRLR